MIAPIVAPPGLRSIASTADCLDDPASVAFDGAGLNEADFDFNAGSDDFDVTLDETLTVVGRFAKCPRLCASFLGLDMGLLVAIDPSFASMTASRAVTGTAPPDRSAGLGGGARFYRARSNREAASNDQPFDIHRDGGLRLQYVPAVFRSLRPTAILTTPLAARGNTEIALDVFDCCSAVHDSFQIAGHSDAPRAREVEQIRSNLMAHIKPIGA
jgi:hypothetical protein